MHESFAQHLAQRTRCAYIFLSLIQVGFGVSLVVLSYRGNVAGWLLVGLVGWRMGFLELMKGSDPLD